MGEVSVVRLATSEPLVEIRMSAGAPDLSFFRHSPARAPWLPGVGLRPGGPDRSTPDLDDENTAPGGDGKVRRPRRTWASVAVVTALALASAAVWQDADDKEQRKEREAKAAAYKGRSKQHSTSTASRPMA